MPAIPVMIFAESADGLARKPLDTLLESALGKQAEAIRNAAPSKGPGTAARAAKKGAER